MLFQDELDEEVQRSMQGVGSCWQCPAPGLRSTAILSPGSPGVFEMLMSWLFQGFRSRFRSGLCSRVCRSFPAGSEAPSHSVEHGEWSGRQLLQARQQNGTAVPEQGGQLYVRNCTEPGRRDTMHP